MSSFTAVKYFITTRPDVWRACVCVRSCISLRICYIWQIVENYTRCTYHMSLPSLPRSLAFQRFNLEHNQSGSSCPIYELLHRLGAERGWIINPLSDYVVIYPSWLKLLHNGAVCYCVYIYITLCMSKLWRLLIFMPELYIIWYIGGDIEWTIFDSRRQMLKVDMQKM